MWLKDSPIILKVFVVPGVVASALASIGGIALRGGDRWLLPLAVVAALLGLALILDLGGAARGLAQIGARNRRTVGLDDNASGFASPAFARVFGVLMIVVGVGMGANALSAM